MKIRSTLLGAVLTGALAATALTPASATAATEAPPGTTSLAEVLTSDGNRFDRNRFDFDIVTEAVLAVVAAKPDSAVALLADGEVALTAFIPNDRAFKALVKDLTGKWYKSERKTFKKLVKLAGVDTIEAVLLYHVVPGVTIDSAAALQADGAELTTALDGATFTVRVIDPALARIRLIDLDTNDRNPSLAQRRLDINAGNLQIAHGIRLVLRPIDL